MTIAHLSDLHWSPYTGQKEISAAVEASNSLRPDLVALTGDFVFQSAEYAAPCAQELARLRAPLGVFAIPGNHDYWTDIATVVRALRGAGLTVLRNTALRLEGTVPLWIVGVDDVWEQHHDLDTALAPVPRDGAVLLLVHEPDFADQVAASPYRILLQLSGHSHGGQVNLPGLGRPLLPWLGRKYPAGLAQVPGTMLQVHTSRGVGVISPPVRFNCRPVVTLLTLSTGN
jgi:predicted MPP superfamily phosphohydrolase